MERYRTRLVIGLLAAIAVGVVLFSSQSDSGRPIQVVVPTATATPSPEVKVYISGAVKAPGVYTLNAGDRIQDAIQRAGGALEDAELDRINLAARVKDAQQIHVPRVGEVPSRAQSPTGPTQKINLNTATAELLDTLPGIGAVRSKRIIDSRSLDGPFTDTQQLVERKLISASLYDRIKDLVAVD